MKNILFLFLITTTVISCKKAQTEAELQQEEAKTAVQTSFDKLQQEAMEAHDAIMPKMGDLMKLKKELGVIEAADPSIEEQKMALQVAHDDMMSWMHSYSEKFPYEFKLPEDPTAAAQKLEEMKEEHRKIVELKDRTINAIAQAEELLDQ